MNEVGGRLIDPDYWAEHHLPFVHTEYGVVYENENGILKLGPFDESQARALVDQAQAEGKVAQLIRRHYSDWTKVW